jgi:predicted nucleic acid-binding protein
MRVYLDANVFVYAVGGTSPHREPCRELLRATVAGRLSGETSVYTLQEVARQRQRRGDGEATARAREVAMFCETLHPVDERVVLDALSMVDRHPSLDIADAVHAATAVAEGLVLFVSADRGLDAVDDIERIDPLDSARLAALMND